MIEVLNKDSQQPKGIYVLNMDTKTTIGLVTYEDLETISNSANLNNNREEAMIVI